MRGFPRPTRAVIDLDACARNLGRIRDRVGERHVWAVVKADAYGHGAAAVARRLAAAGTDGFAVATVGEAVELRHAGIGAPILVMAGLAPFSREGALACAEHRLAVAVWDVETARRIGAVALEGQGPVSLHLKVDTGMGRLGVAPEEAVGVARELAAVAGELAGSGDRGGAGPGGERSGGQLPGEERPGGGPSGAGPAGGVRFDGVFSNLAASDQPPGSAGWAHTETQARRFARLCDELETAGVLPPHRHLANSAAIFHHPETWQPAWCTGVRPGLALYGASLRPGPTADAASPGPSPTPLEPVMSLWTAVAGVRQVPEGWPLGYGLRRVVDRPSRIAVLPVGYHDGWPRALSDRAAVLVRGRRAPVVGAISMDLTLVDVTGLEGVAVGDAVLLFGRDEAGVSIAVEEVSELAGSIPHELLSRIGSRVPRHLVGGAA